MIAVKKFAMMLMNPLFQPEQHNALFQTGDIENHIFTVRDEKEALAKVSDLIRDGFGILEVCGAFSSDLVQAMRNAAGSRLCIGAVAYRPEDEAALEQYWSEE